MPRWINMRHELGDLINGDPRTVAQGHWLVLRMMRIGEYSQYWNPARSEAIGGPKWLYDDYLIRGITFPGATFSTRPRLKASELTIADAGLDDTASSVFAIEYNPLFGRQPLAGEDLVYEIDQCASFGPPVPPLTVNGRYRVMRVVPNYGDNGRIENYYILGTRVQGES